MPKFAEDLNKLTAEGATDGRLDVTAFHTNSDPILGVLHEVINSTKNGDVVEIGSGSGQHVSKFAAEFPFLTFWPTDPNPGHCRSINAWRQFYKIQNVNSATELDVRDDWKSTGLAFEPKTLAAIITINVLHIAPWSVSEAILRCAGQLLRQDGHLIIYGPFARDGIHIAKSNSEFDEALRQKNPEWGVRDLSDITKIAESRGLILKGIFEMPANNFTLVYKPRQPAPAVL